MKNRLTDILHEKWNETQSLVYDKFIKLHKTIEATNPNIDDLALRWVEKKVEDLEDGVILERKDLEQANSIYKRFITNRR